MERRERTDSRARRWIVPALGVLLALAAGCMRAPTVIPPHPIDSYAFRQMQAGVRVAVDPYFTQDRLQVAFSGGEEFPRNGLLPVQVLIENGGRQDLRVDPRDFRLARPDGTMEIALSLQEALAVVRVSMGWWALGGGVIGGAAPAFMNQGRQKSLELRALKEAAIPAGSSLSGFVYFRLSDTDKTLRGDVIVFPLNGPGGQGITFEVPIDGQLDLPATEKRPGVAETAKPPAPTPLDPHNPQGATRIEGAGGGVIIRSPAP